MRRPKFHKVYFAGLITAVFLPVLLSIYFLYGNLSKKTAGLNVVWGNKSNTGLWETAVKQSFDHGIFKRFNNSVLTGNQFKDSIVLAIFEKEVNLLKSSNDTTKGLSISFTSHTKYNEIVRSVDICSKYSYSQLSFILYGDKIIIWKGEPYRMRPQSSCVNMPL